MWSYNTTFVGAVVLLRSQSSGLESDGGPRAGDARTSAAFRVAQPGTVRTAAHGRSWTVRSSLPAGRKESNGGGGLRETRNSFTPQQRKPGSGQDQRYEYKINKSNNKIKTQVADTYPGFRPGGGYLLSKVPPGHQGPPRQLGAPRRSWAPGYQGPLGGQGPRKPGALG